MHLDVPSPLRPIHARVIPFTPAASTPACSRSPPTVRPRARHILCLLHPMFPPVRPAFTPSRAASSFQPIGVHRRPSPVPRVHFLSFARPVSSLALRAPLAMPGRLASFLFRPLPARCRSAPAAPLATSPLTRPAGSRTPSRRRLHPPCSHGQPAEQIDELLRVQEWLAGLLPRTQGALQMVRFGFGGVWLG